jgi:hypothetical protein
MSAVLASNLACAQDRPNHTNALSQITTLLSNDDGALSGGSALAQLAWKDSNGSSRDFTITKPEYVNGYQKDTNHYIVAATYTRTFKVSLSGIFKKLADDPLLPAALIWGHFESGDSFDESCNFSFLRTEKGWIIQGYEGGFSVVTSHMEHQAREAIQRQKDEVQGQKDEVQRQKDAVQSLIDVKNACASSQQVKIHNDYKIGRLEDVGGRMQRDDKGWGIVPDNGQVVGCLSDIIYRGEPWMPAATIPFCHIQFQYGEFRFVDKIGNKLVSGYFDCRFLSVVK